jgi:hypothetical protein
MQFQRFWRALDLVTIPLRPFVWAWMAAISTLLNYVLSKSKVKYDRQDRKVSLQSLEDLSERELGRMEAYVDAISLLFFIFPLVSLALWAPETMPWLLAQLVLGVIGLGVCAEMMNGDVTATEVVG